jgi:large subunit ribosomal protein L14
MKGIPGTQTNGLPVGANLDCIDNTGARIVEIVTVPGKGSVHRRTPAAAVGDKILVAVKDGTPEMRRELHQAVVVRARRPFRRPDGTMVQFEDNAAVIITETGETRGSDIKGPVAREAAERWPRVGALASNIV